MKAIILAAGQGSRLGHLVDNRPKCLIDFNGRTLLNRQLDTLEANGVEEAVVVTGFHDELVEKAIAERSGGPTVRTVFNPFYKVADNTGSLYMAREELSGYLLTGSTNAAFLDQARAALDQTLQWMEQKALTVARFYLTVGNGRGARIEVERLLANPDARRRSEAVAMLDEAKRLEVAAEDKRGRIKGALVPEPVEAEKGDRGSAGQ